MGWSSSWIAVQGAPKGEILESLGVVETGEEILPGGRRAGLSCGDLPNGWVVLFSEDFDWATAERVLDLSRLGLALGCQFEDKVMMTSMAWAAKDGVELWRVFHDKERSVYRLDVVGEPPPAFTEIRDRLVREQDEDGGEGSGTDYIHDVPVEVARAVCGYRHDEYEPAFGGLKPIGAPDVVEPPKLSLLEKLLAPLRPHRWDESDD